MEITMDKLLNILMTQVESLSVAVEDLRLKQNVLGTLFYDQNLITEEKLKNAVKKQTNILKAINPEEKMSDEEINQFTKEILKWFKCDIPSIKADLERYQQMLKQMAKEAPAQEKGRIQVASPGLLDDLERMKKIKM